MVHSLDPYVTETRDVNKLAQARNRLEASQEVRQLLVRRQELNAKQRVRIEAMTRGAVRWFLVGDKAHRQMVTNITGDILVLIGQYMYDGKIQWDVMHMTPTQSL